MDSDFENYTITSLTTAIEQMQKKGDRKDIDDADELECTKLEVLSG